MLTSDNDAVEKCNKKCLVPCKSVYYGVQISHAEYPSQFSAELVKTYVNESFSHDYLR